MENDPQPQRIKRPPSKSIKQPGKGGKKRRRRGGIRSIVVIIILLAIAGLFIWAEIQRRSAIDQLKETEQQLAEVRTSTQRSGQEVANEVLSKVRSHIDLPQEPAPTVATIVDVERLRESSEFYNRAENGDHLIITENRAILYDPDRDLILDVVPVRTNQNNANQQPAEASSTPTPTPDPNASPTPVTGPEGEGIDGSPNPSASPTTTPGI